MKFIIVLSLSLRGEFKLDGELTPFSAPVVICAFESLEACREFVEKRRREEVEAYRKFLSRESSSYFQHSFWSWKLILVYENK